MIHKEVIEAWHVGLLRGYSEIARKVLERRNGPGEEVAWVLQMTDDEDAYVMRAVSTLSLPKGSGELMEEMAKFSLIAPLSPEFVIDPTGKHVIWDALPKHSFCMRELTLSAYPRSLEDNVFKFTRGGDAVLDVEELHTEICDDGPFPDEELQKHVAFAGLGVILLDAIRHSKSFTPSSDDFAQFKSAKSLVYDCKESILTIV